MDTKEFNELVKGLPLSAEQIEMARRVLVAGESRAQVAAAAGTAGKVSKTLYGRLQGALDRIVTRKLEQEGAPRNWRVVTVVVPRVRADEIRAIAKQAMAERLERRFEDVSLKGARAVPVRKTKKKPRKTKPLVGGRVGGVQIRLGLAGVETKMIEPSQKKSSAKPKKPTTKPKSTTKPKATGKRKVTTKPKVMGKPKVTTKPKTVAKPKTPAKPKQQPKKTKTAGRTPSAPKRKAATVKKKKKNAGRR